MGVLGGARSEQSNKRHRKPDVVNQDPGVTPGEVPISDHLLEVQTGCAEQKDTERNGEHKPRGAPDVSGDNAGDAQADADETELVLESIGRPSDVLCRLSGEHRVHDPARDDEVARGHRHHPPHRGVSKFITRVRTEWSHSDYRQDPPTTRVAGKARTAMIRR